MGQSPNSGIKAATVISGLLAGADRIDDLDVLRAVHDRGGCERHLGNSDRLQHLRSGVAPDLSGIWHSRYLYYRSGRGREFEDEHCVVLRQRGNGLVGQSLPHSTDSRLRLNLSIDGSIATST